MCVCVCDWQWYVCAPPPPHPPLLTPHFYFPLKLYVYIKH